MQVLNTEHEFWTQTFIKNVNNSYNKESITRKTIHKVLSEVLKYSQEVMTIILKYYKI